MSVAATDFRAQHQQGHSDAALRPAPYSLRSPSLLRRLGLSVTVAIALLLAGCDDSKERAEFEAACVNAEFTPKQCGFIYALKSDGDAAAMANSALTGVALGMAASSGARR